jgi:hypothetical protein
MRLEDGEWVIYRTEDGEPWNICSTEPYRESDADAALIHTASDVLAALQVAERVLALGTRANAAEVRSALAEIRVAIANAEGRTRSPVSARCTGDY